MSYRNRRPHALVATALIVVGLPVLAGAKGEGCGGNDSIPIGSDSGGSGGGTPVGQCTPDDCGPALGMPNFECPDGTIAGPTGKCIQTENGCGWEVVECPVTCQSDADCPAVGACPQCENGTCANFTCDSGQCVFKCPDPPACQSDADCPAIESCVQCGDGTCAEPVCQDGQCVPQCPTTSGLTWWTTCGDPVCQSPDPDDPNIPNCTTQSEGGPCQNSGEICEIVSPDACGAKLMCTTSDPTNGGNCPISRASYKYGIRYLNDGEMQRAHDELVKMKLARWHYKTEASDAREHLGFIIDDDPNSPAVAASGDRVDLYGYTSMTAAAVQVQEQRIESLERELKALRDELARCR